MEKTTNNRRMRTLTAAVVVSCSATAFAQNTATVDGVWTLSAEAGHVIQIGMELKQDGTKVTGKILMPSSDGRRRTIVLKGEFVDGALKASGPTKADNESGDQANDDHASDLVIAGKMLSDGTMSGDLTMPQHSATWTAERLGKQ